MVIASEHADSHFLTRDGRGPSGDPAYAKISFAWRRSKKENDFAYFFYSPGRLYISRGAQPPTWGAPPTPSKRLG